MNVYQILAIKCLKNAKSKLINMVTNGDFSNGTTGWSVSLASQSVLDGVLSILATGQYGKSYQLFTGVVGHAYYAAAKLNGSSNAFISIGGTDGSIKSSPSSGENRVSLVKTSTNTAMSVQLGDSRTSGWTSISFKDILVIDLTAIFGAGNEPTQAQMDKLIKLYHEFIKSKLKSPFLIKANKFFVDL